MNRVMMVPQPLCGAPFRIAFQNRGSEFWYSVRKRYQDTGRGDMLFEWKYPFGVYGEPQKIDGVWFWVQTEKGNT